MPAEGFIYTQSFAVTKDADNLFVLRVFFIRIFLSQLENPITHGGLNSGVPGKFFNLFCCRTMNSLAFS